MKRDFTQLTWSPQLADDVRRLTRLAVFEDLDRGQDWTTVCLVGEASKAAANIVARQAGVMAGLAAIPALLDEMEIEAELRLLAADGDAVPARTTVATIAGSARDLLTSERTILNLLGRLSGIATQTRHLVDAIAGTKARLYDTRKTIPGWRRLEKYAVHCGGGHNHRTGLYDAILIKDNHLALGRDEPVLRLPKRSERRGPFWLSKSPERFPAARPIRRCSSKSRSIRLSNCARSCRRSPTSCCSTTCRPTCFATP
jgi:nicotinate-nucleotide pyrophosphorylase (carboxylating)